MKKKLLFLCCSICAFQYISAQVIDTVSIGAGYLNQVWYSLSNDNQGTATKNSWDLAFDVSGFGSSIHINSATGTALWQYPTKDTSGWSTLDTAGIKKWNNRWNTDTSWVKGAFDIYANPSNQFDVGWGVYSLITHAVTGDSLYIIKLSTNVYKKLWIQALSGGTFTFRYANLDGSDEVNAQVVKSIYPTKNFAYYSIQNKATLDREPDKTSWDIVFTQYTTFIPIPYTVTGILHNKGVSVADVRNVANPGTFNNWSAQKFSTAINEIGYDWKSFTGSTYEIKDSLVYFIKTASGNIWKLIPTGFGGSANGNFIFSKEKLQITTIKNEAGNLRATLAVYPNPSNGENTTIIYNLENEVSKAMLHVYDLSGRIIHSELLDNSSGLHTSKLNTSGFRTGMYFINLEIDGNSIQQKLIVN